MTSSILQSINGSSAKPTHTYCGECGFIGNPRRMPTGRIPTQELTISITCGTITSCRDSVPRGVFIETYVSPDPYSICFGFGYTVQTCVGRPASSHTQVGHLRWKSNWSNWMQLGTITVKLWNWQRTRMQRRGEHCSVEEGED